MVWRMALWVAFLQHAFKMKWDGFPLIHVDSATGHILEVLQALVEKDWTDARFEDGESFGVHWVNFASELRRLGGYAIAAVCKHLDVEAACHVWLNHSPNPAYRHIFTYQFLFTKYDHWQFFRTACHSHMRQAVKGASFVQYARQRIFPFLIQKDGKYLDRRLKTVQESYLVLKISRKNVIRDALDQLWQRESRQLHKPLRVSLGTGEGEMGQDLGGVQIEFFNLLCRELFEGDRPLFTTDAATQLSWFGVGSLEPLHRYELVGVLFGLAIYNGITLPVSFPSALYKKLMGYRTDRNDLREGWPEVHKSLQDIEDYTDDVETDLALEQTYTIRANGLDLSIDSRYYGFDYYNPEIPQERKARVQVYWAQSDKDKMKNGTSRVVEADGEEDSTKGEEEPDVENLFWPGWEFTMAPSDESPLPVTNENRSEYIKQYATWLLDYSIRPQFYAFACGFYEVLDPRTMRILAPESLRELVEGRSHIDIEDLKRLITYEGYTAESEQIKWFWAILDEYDQEKLRLLLEFVTGSKRMPASGQRSLRFNITRIDGDSESLPGASTCFGNLLLPEYSSKEKMEKKLGIALEHSLGFGQA
ncbi:E3 ubiquitin-protein ligase RSP5-like protein [Elsinoe fawcettii]|nr:E3 ubiquitin-protein ligase RSP5-like protein [Elsinoe fawcettii]